IKRFGAYEILHELSTGGMGSVLLGRRKGPGSFEQLVAIKTIRTEYAAAAHVRAMFLDEAAILARLNHPAVATVHDFGEENGTLYMVMEYVAGVSLRGMVGQMPAGVAARAIAEACRGLHAAHELRDLSGQLLGLVHRDISPDNIMLGFDGHVKVIDFGIALVKNRQSPVTEFGTVKGKPPYMSPEQVKNEGIDRRSDVFSLGIVMHEVVTGTPLFDGDSIYAIARAVEHQDIRPPSHVLGMELPLGLDAAVMNALDRDLARRTPTAAAFAEELEQVINIAGDETLEAWADRELAAPRDAHRSWLASVVAGKDAPRSSVGRPTGSVTALGAEAAAPVAEELPAGRETPTHLPAPETGELRPARRSMALPVVLALLVLAAIGGGMAMFARRADDTPRDAAVALVTPADAALDAELDAAPAAPPDAIEADALSAVPVDGPKKTVALDAGAKTVARDAAEKPIDAPAAVKVEGFGKLTVRSGEDSYLVVHLDGEVFDDTPFFRKQVPAGEHLIELIHPKTKERVLRKKIFVAPGETVEVSP
nr:serine/threonine protein kinase [Deltaproteobacteria bacterium]